MPRTYRQARRVRVALGRSDDDLAESASLTDMGKRGGNLVEGEGRGRCGS